MYEINSKIPNIDFRIVAVGLYLLSFVYENIFPFERDINSYRALLWGTNTLDLKGYFPPMLETIGLFFRNIHPFYLNLQLSSQF